MLLVVNSLIQYGEEKNHVERILWMDEKRINCFVIHIFMDRYPEMKSIMEIEDGIKNKDILLVEEGQYYNPVFDETLSDKAKGHFDLAWGMIADLVDLEPDIFDPHLRKQMIQQTLVKSEVSEKTIGRYLRTYWKKGKKPYALVPLFSNKGKSKSKGVGEVKRGRPKKYSQIEGINVTAEIEQIFRTALKKYYYTSKKAPLKFAYQQMVKEWFTDSQIQDGEKKLVIRDSIPSFTQFKYFFKKENNIRREVSTRYSAKKYELMHRPVLGSATSEAMGPGSKFLLDGTSFDIYLVSRLNRNWIIGRPCLFYVQDVFSRMVTGVYVGLESSWLSAAMAIANSTENKVSFCEQYGISIQPEQWESHHLCETILGDRGELFTKEVEKIIKILHVKIQNTSSYRGDLKGILERHFRTTNDTVKMMLPGVINPDFRQRGPNSRDYRLDAKLDLYQFTQIIIRSILHHNNHFLASYNREEMMISDDVESIPSKLWRWGVKNRSGKLREVPREIVLLNVLPISKATITFRGILFQGLYYSCNFALKERWMENARNGTWKVSISYDPRSLGTIYLRGVGERGYEPCFLLNQYEHFANKTKEEVEYFRAMENMQQANQQEQALQPQIDLIAHIEAIVKDAERQTKEQQEPSSKAEKLRGIQEYRNIEKQMIRQNEAFQINKGQVEQKRKDEEIAGVESDNDNYFGDINLFRKMKKEWANERDDPNS